MLVIGLLLYIAILFVLVKLNIYVALGFILVTSVVMKSVFPQLKGYVGEKRIRKILDRLGEEYTVFNDVYVPKKDGKTTQIDHVLLSPYGMFVIETKNYTGWIFGQEHQKNWTQTIYKKKSRFYNPIMQNNTHMKALQHYLQIDVPMFSIIVFSNEATFKFKQPFEQAHVIPNKLLVRTVKKYTTKYISREQLYDIQRQLQALKPTTTQQKSEIKKEHIRHVKETVNPVKIAATSTSNCPKCGSALVLRHGKRGAFYGCQGFPGCRFTRGI